MPTPMIAAISGRPAATREPNVSSSTTAATARPISSAEPPGISGACAALPLSSTVSPASRAT